MNGFARRTEKKKESIRKAAIELFRQYGFDKVSMNDIARAAHVSHVTIYNHFGSKEELVRDIIKAVVSERIAHTRELVESDRPFLEKLEMMITGKVESLRQFHGELTRVWIKNYPELYRHFLTIWQNEAIPLVDKLMKEGRESGYVDPDISSEAVHFYMDIIRKGLIESDFASQKSIDVQLAREINKLFIFGLVRNVPSDNLISKPVKQDAPRQKS